MLQSRPALAGHTTSALERTALSAVPLFAVLALLSALAFATRSVVAKAGPVQMPLALLLLMQSALSLPLLWGIAKFQRISLRPANVPLGTYAWRVFWGIATTVMLFAALKLMPAALASTLGYSAPLFLAMLALRGPACLFRRELA